MDELADIYANTDRIRQTRRKYNDLKQSANQPFNEFYAEFIMLGLIIGYEDTQLRNDLLNKTQQRLQEAFGLTRRTDEDQSLLKLKTYLRAADNTQRASYQFKQQQRTLKEKTATPPARRVISTVTPTRAYSATGLYTPLVKPVTKTETPREVTCYNCGETGHYKK